MSLITALFCLSLLAIKVSCSWLCSDASFSSVCWPDAVVYIEDRVVRYAASNCFLAGGAGTETQDFSISKVRCSAACAQRMCVLMVHDNGQRCRLVGHGLGAPTATPPSGYLTSVATAGTLHNVALHKSVTASSSHVKVTLDPADVTDGIFDDPTSFFHSLVEPTPWIVVDLEHQFHIVGVRILPRMDAYFSDRFLEISIRVGVNPVSGPDFSSYTEVVLIPGPPTNPVTFFTITLLTPVCGRFVSVQRTSTSAANSFLEVTELEVLTLAL